MRVAFSMYESCGSRETRGDDEPTWEQMGLAVLPASSLLPAMLRGGWR